jgi:hypothetical protein
VSPPPEKRSRAPNGQGCFPEPGRARRARTPSDRCRRLAFDGIHGQGVSQSALGRVRPTERARARAPQSPRRSLRHRRRGTRWREPVHTTQLDPHPTGVEQAAKGREGWAIRAFHDVGAAHLVDDDGRADRPDERLVLDQPGAGHACTACGAAPAPRCAMKLDRAPHIPAAASLRISSSSVAGRIKASPRWRPAPIRSASRSGPWSNACPGSARSPIARTRGGRAAAAAPPPASFGVKVRSGGSGNRSKGPYTRHGGRTPPSARPAGVGVDRDGVPGRLAMGHPWPRQSHRAIMPPSTTISVPVMNRASSDARNNAAFAVSRPSPMNPRGMRATRLASSASTSPPDR